jgi:hypothetical protein
MPDDDYVPRPVPQPYRVAPVGRAEGRQPGIQQEAPLPEKLLEPPVNRNPVNIRTDRAKRGWEKRRSRHQLPDRHALGEDPIAVALASLYAQRDKITKAIKVLEDVREKP